MTDYPLDIIIPVWNRPVEVRSALASFSSDAPDSRLVIVNNGSERETERILDEFAEALDDRAILISTERNIGTVAAINLGLGKSTAPFALIATPFTRLVPGWLDSVLALFDRKPGSGAVVLREKSSDGRCYEFEADRASFSSMVIRKSLYDVAGGFDEGMDGGEWALRDFVRRATRAGYTTYSMEMDSLRLSPVVELGSAARRQERELNARRLYVERWGEPLSYLVVCQDSLFGINDAEFRNALLEAARQGNRISVIAENRVGRQLFRDGFSSLHENIVLNILPKFFSSRALNRILASFAVEQPAAILVSENDSLSGAFKRLVFTGFVSEIARRRNMP
jgi:glycosyltransferase involved in cell wall biosynthesis